MGGIINLKKRSMVFENNGTRVVVPLDPAEGKCYTEPIPKGEDVDYIYKLTVRDVNNPTEGEVLFSEADIEDLSDPDKEIETWKNRLHNVSTLRCLCITKYFLVPKVRSWTEPGLINYCEPTPGKGQADP